MSHLVQLTFEVQLVTLSAAERLALSDDNSRHDLLSEFGLTLLHASQEQLTDGTLGESAHAGTDLGDGDDVQVLGTGVVSAVHDTKGRQTCGNSKLDAGSSSSGSFAHFVFS